jgi:hypothetical protein
MDVILEFFGRLVFFNVHPMSAAPKPKVQQTGHYHVTLHKCKNPYISPFPLRPLTIFKRPELCSMALRVLSEVHLRILYKR